MRRRRGRPCSPRRSGSPRPWPHRRCGQRGGARGERRTPRRARAVQRGRGRRPSGGRAGGRSAGRHCRQWRPAATPGGRSSPERVAGPPSPTARAEAGRGWGRGGAARDGPRVLDRSRRSRQTVVSIYRFDTSVGPPEGAARAGGRDGERRVLELAILGLLKEQELHGYELKRRLTQMLGLFSSVSFGSLYPALSRLEAAGAVQAVDTPPATPPLPAPGPLRRELAAFKARDGAARRGRGKKGYRGPPPGRGPLEGVTGG